MTSESETCTSPTEIPAPAIATHLLEGGGGFYPVPRHPFLFLLLHSGGSGGKQ